MNSKNDLYKYDLMDHAKTPRNYGLMSEVDFCVKQQNLSCGDSVTMCGQIDQGKVKKLSFEGSGCVLSMAMASKLTEHLVAKSLDEIMQLDDQVVELLLGMELGINRLQCGLLSVVAVKQGIREYLQQQACQ